MSALMELDRDEDAGLLEWSCVEEGVPHGRVHQTRYVASVRHLAYPSVRATATAYTPVDARRQARRELVRRMGDVLYRISAWGPYSYAR
jgi:hypothetical protein